MLLDGPFSHLLGKIYRIVIPVHNVLDKTQIILKTPFHLNSIADFYSCAFQKSAHTTALHEQWLGIFLLASRLLTAEKCSRAASFLLYVLLDLKILSYGEIASIAETILGSIEVQGPTLVSESSLALLGLLMNARATENPNSTTTTAERLVQWIFQKWTPSKFYNEIVGGFERDRATRSCSKACYDPIPFEK
jgi:hypothetical protein